MARGALRPAPISSDAGIDATAARAVEIARAGAASRAGASARRRPSAYVDTFRNADACKIRRRSARRRAWRCCSKPKRLPRRPANRGRARVDGSVAHRQSISTARSARASRSRSIKRGSGIAGDGRRATATCKRERFPATSALYKRGGWEVIEEARLRENARAHRRRSRRAACARRNVRAARSTSSSAARKCRCRSTNRAATPPNSTASWAGKRTSPARVFLRSISSERLKYGSDIVTIVIDNTMPRGLATVRLRRRRHEERPLGHHSRRHARRVRDVQRHGARRSGAQSNACVRARELGVRSDDPHVQSQSAARERRRSSTCSTTSKTASIWKQSLVVDRRSPPELSIRLRDCVGNQERQTRAHAQESDVRRHYAAILEFVRRDRRRELVDRVGHAELRQGRTDANRSHGASAPRPRAFRNVDVGVGYDG